MATVIPANTAPFSVWELATVTDGQLTRLPDDHARVTGVVTDSRAVVAGNAFLAVRGESFDGHQFLGVAIERGATVVVVERGRVVPPGAVAVIEVEDVVIAFGRIARAHVRHWRRDRSHISRVAAVTGSAGKTTTKELIAVILSAMGPCHATTGNLNNRIGVPAVALGLHDEPYAVFELGMSVPGEIAALTTIVEPDVALLLNVGVAHAEGFGGSRSGIAREKGAIFDSLTADGVAVFNVDDPAAHAQRLRTGAKHVGFGIGRDADVRLVSRTIIGANGSRVTIDRRGTTFDVSLPIPGEAAAIDLVAAIAVADAIVGHPIPTPVIAGTVRSWEPLAGRSVTLALQGDVVVLDDSYNANPASMRAAFATLQDIRRSGRGRSIAVLGEMRELGAISDREHEELGAELVRRGVELVIGCGGSINLALKRAEAGGVAVRYASGSAEAGAVVAREVRAGDVVLFKGSRGAAVENALAALLASYPPLASGQPGSRGPT
jgi:UDP-N-acetylmuramoyl-tripeptide--D-alanyl-D-alanine ligase